MCPELVPSNCIWSRLLYSLSGVFSYNYQSLALLIEKRDHSIAKGHSKLELYSRVKRVFGKENYVDLIWNSKARSAVTKIRISAHHFSIERGRYQNIERNDRVCTICDQNVMGNEIHYVMFCSNKLMVEEREIFLEIYIK